MFSAFAANLHHINAVGFAVRDVDAETDLTRVAHPAAVAAVVAVHLYTNLAGAAH